MVCSEPRSRHGRKRNAARKKGQEEGRAKDTGGNGGTYLNKHAYTHVCINAHGHVYTHVFAQALRRSQETIDADRLVSGIMTTLQEQCNDARSIRQCSVRLHEWHALPEQLPKGEQCFRALVQSQLELAVASLKFSHYGVDVLCYAFGVPSELQSDWGPKLPDRLECKITVKDISTSLVDRWNEGSWSKQTTPQLSPR